MLKRFLLILALPVLLWSCSDDTEDSNAKVTPVPLPDTCMLSSINSGIPSTSITLVYDSVTYLPISGTIGTSVMLIYQYNNTQYRLITKSATSSDTTSVITITVDADKKATILRARTLSQGNIFVNSTQTFSYNQNKTLNGISSFSYKQSALGGEPFDSAYSEEKLYWTNGNLTTDSVFSLINKGTPQETKVLSFIRRWEFGTQPDIKGVSEWLINTTYIAKLFGERSKNLVNKIITQQPSGSSSEIIVTYLLNANKWPTNITLSGGQGGASYGYTCFKRR